MFNISKDAGKRSFVSNNKPVIWNDGLFILNVSKTHFTFSKELCEKLSVEDNSILTFFPKEGEVYLGNIDSQIKESNQTKHLLVDGGAIARNETLTVTKQKPNIKQKDGVNYYMARQASNKNLLTAFLNENNYNCSLGEYQIGGLVECEFPCVKIIPISGIKEESDENVENTSETNRIIEELSNIVIDDMDYEEIESTNEVIKELQEEAQEEVQEEVQELLQEVELQEVGAQKVKEEIREFFKPEGDALGLGNKSW